MAPQRNLEIKARDSDPRRSLELALELVAEDRGEIVQLDTYTVENAAYPQSQCAEASAIGAMAAGASGR
jgi:hypothetical protein